jgi:hypothetical protein
VTALNGTPGAFRSPDRTQAAAEGKCALRYVVFGDPEELARLDALLDDDSAAGVTPSRYGEAGAGRPRLAAFVTTRPNPAGPLTKTPAFAP